MAIRNIVKFGKDDILRKKAREVTEFNARLSTLLDDMRETMHNADGVGLAAPQVGILRRVVVIEVEEKFYELINPEIIYTQGEQTGNEGCLSFPGQYGTVTRPLIVKVKAYDRLGNQITIKGEGMLARAILHEVDHLNGVLFIDHVQGELNKEQ